MRLEGKVALISGAASGIGAATARLFAREGSGVVIADIQEDKGQAVAREIVDSGGRALFIKLDVTVEEEWRRAVKRTVDEFGKLDILVNDAGISQIDKVEELSKEGWDAVMGVNAKGTFLGTKHAIPAMRKAGGGSIVNISSGAGLVGNPDGAGYGASKGAVRIFTKATAVQYAADGIRANSIHPGPIDTPMLHSSPGDAQDRDLPMKRRGTADEIAYGVLYLASNEASYVTGAELAIDGGRTAQ